MRRSYGWIPALFATALGFTATTARAQGSSSDVDAAQKLYDEATLAMDSGNFAVACPKLEQVTRLVPEGLGAHATLAECYEGADKLARALAEYSLVAPAAAEKGQADREKLATQKVAELSARVASLSVDVPESLRKIPGLTVRLDGAPISESDWGSATPVDGGAHTIDIDAPARRRSHEEIFVRDGEHRVTTAAFHDSEPVTTRRGADSRPRAWQLPTGASLTAIGGASLGVGLGLGAVALSRKSAADGECNQSLSCNAKGLELRHQGRVFADAATALVVIGGASAGAGIILMATSPSRATRPGASAALTVGPLSVGVDGRF